MISVIVPVYNVENYLHYAIESLMKQTYKNFEVILVDDGSTDKSGKICDEYAEKYDNIKVYHKKNEGQAVARNYGIEKSNGEFIVFLDSDDYLEDYALEFLITAQKKYNVNIVMAREVQVSDFNSYLEYKISESDFSRAGVVSNKNTLKKMYYNNGISVSPCAKLFKREILLEEKFPEGMIYEDLAVAASVLKKEKEVYISPLKIYNYYKRTGSTVNGAFSDKQYDFFKAIEYNREVIEKFYGNDEDILRALHAKIVIGSFMLSNRAIISSPKDIKKIKSLIKPYLIEVLKDKNVKVNKKIQCLAFFISHRLYYKIKKYIKD